MMIFIYCNWVSVRWQLSVDLYKNRKEKAQKEKQYTTQYKTKKKHKKNIKNHKSSNLYIIKRSK